MTVFVKKIAESMTKMEHFIAEKEYVYDLEEKWSELFMMIDTMQER